MHTTTAPADALLDAATRLAAELQADPTHHVAYVAVDHPTLVAELADAPDWRRRAVVAQADDGAVTGLLVADVDADRRRVWWLGPWCTEHAAGRALLSAGDALVAGIVDSEEFAPDSRNETLGALATERGCTAETPSLVLSLPAPLADDTATAATLPLRPQHHAAVVALHDATFPDTHLTGAALVGAQDTFVRTVTLDNVLAGYVAYEVQADGRGYVDYLAVDDQHRRAGFGRLLVRAAVADLHARGCSGVSLTVRTNALGAADLYRSVGFVEERTIQPWRRGFSLG